MNPLVGAASGNYTFKRWLKAFTRQFQRFDGKTVHYSRKWLTLRLHPSYGFDYGRQSSVPHLLAFERSSVHVFCDNIHFHLNFTRHQLL